MDAIGSQCHLLWSNATTAISTRLANSQIRLSVPSLPLGLASYVKVNV